MMAQVRYSVEWRKRKRCERALNSVFRLYLEHTTVPTTTMLFSLAGHYQSRVQDSAKVQGSKMGQRLLGRKKFGF